MKRQRERFAESILKPINPSMIIILGAYTILWGLWIMSPFWPVFNDIKMYSIMANIGSEYFWGGVAVASGFVTLIGAIRTSAKNLQWGSFVSSLHWIVIAILYFVGDWASTGGITALTFSIYSAIVWLNIKLNKCYFNTMFKKNSI